MAAVSCFYEFFYTRKKLSKFSQNPNWKNASNYVAKRYMKEEDRNTYFDDVKLQMDSKLWGEEYNKLSVPKKVKRPVVLHCQFLMQFLFLRLTSVRRTL